MTVIPETCHAHFISYICIYVFIISRIIVFDIKDKSNSITHIGSLIKPTIIEFFYCNLG
jgi:hypothetical protein